MRKLSLNDNWTVRPLSREGTPKQVNIPHDAMIDEPRNPLSRGEGNIGWYIGGDYEYTKMLNAPEDWRGQKIVLEFEGVYRNAEVFVNSERVAFRPYGYTNFYVTLDKRLNYGEPNEIKVIAHNSDQPNSRWYTGTGIYRPVNLWLGGEGHIRLNGVRIRTLDYRTGLIDIVVKTSCPGAISIDILDGETVVVSRKHTSQKRSVRFKIQVPEAKLWDTEAPNLYTARVTFGDDVVEEHFGIRSLSWSASSGLTLNGKRVILRGACVHHDNGPLGACAFPEAEERKVRLHKKNGYNALRSAHNPCSKAMLEACDRLGMLMMDEYVDAWYMHKTEYDYAGHVMNWWKRDLKDMVDKDYNHPCVIMYSTGNEVAETAQPRGIQFTGDMTKYLHELDDTRPVSCGINIFFNLLSSMGFGAYSDEKAEKQSKGEKKKKAVGSEFYNKMACLMGDKFMKWGATLRGSDKKTRDAYANMDIAGYNYGIWRYKKDIKKYPNRLILGSETFCKDAWLFWDIAKDNPQVVGDFVWSGMDYIGETGMGAPEYGDYKLTEDGTQMTGGNGRIDITGKPRAEAAYTRVALEQQRGPSIGVQPVDRDDKPALTGWSLTRAVESWSWPGCEGRKAMVEVYARAAEVELKLNNRTVGRRRPNKTCRTLFRVPYEAGRLVAIAYDIAGRIIGQRILISANGPAELRLEPETTSVKPNGLCFVRMRYADINGIGMPTEHHRLTAEVENGALAGMCSGNAYVRGNYTDGATDTYYGEALAVVRANAEGAVTLRVRADGDGEPVSIEIPISVAEPELIRVPEITEIPDTADEDDEWEDLKALIDEAKIEIKATLEDNEE